MTDVTDYLVVALDVFDPIRARQLVRQLRNRVSTFKLGASNLMTTLPTHNLIADVLENNFLMIDLKVWDTPDSVKRIVGDAMALFNPRWITVHPSVAKYALEVAPAGTVLPVAQLTSDPDPDLTPCGYGEVGEAISAAGGAVVPAALARNYSSVFGDKVRLVCPGVRLRAEDSHNHRATVEPRTAIERGASHVVVGRPIVAAPDPTEAAERYLETLR